MRVAIAGPGECSVLAPTTRQANGPGLFGGFASLLTKPYEFIWLGAMHVTKPYEFIGFGAMDVTKHYRFMGFGAMHARLPAETRRESKLGHISARCTHDRGLCIVVI